MKRNCGCCKKNSSKKNKCIPTKPQQQSPCQEPVFCCGCNHPEPDYLNCDKYKKQAEQYAHQASCIKEKAIQLEQQAKELAYQVQCMFNESNELWCEYNELMEEANIYINKYKECSMQNNIPDCGFQNNNQCSCCKPSNCGCNKPVITCKKSGCCGCGNSN